MTLKLTVVDQSPVQLGSGTAADALGASVQLAQACETAGYHRYWLAEHHNSNSFADPCPEILISHIASKTKHMRIGSGGVMLANHSPYKVAEQFRMLATLFPDRIDLGIGRAPGGDQLASAALNYPHRPGTGGHYAEKAQLLAGWMRNSLAASHPFSGLKVMPDDSPSPELWMLGTSGGSAELAGQLGMAMSLGTFITPEGQTPEIFRVYRDAWQSAGHAGTPVTKLTVAALCAETEEEARFQAAPQAHWKVMAFRHGIRQPWLSPAAAIDARRQMSDGDAAYFDALLDSVVLGTPEFCAEELYRLADHWQTEEIGLVTVTHGFEARKASYELLAKAVLNG